MANARSQHRAVTASEMPAEMNVGTVERIGSTVAGAVLLGRALANPSLGRLPGVLAGIVLLRRGLSGHCPMYRALGMDTAHDRQPTPRNAVGDDPVACASDDSFPASDPPSWTPVAGTVSKHQPAAG